jgi:hypothetical protein
VIEDFPVSPRDGIEATFYVISSTTVDILLNNLSSDYELESWTLTTSDLSSPVLGQSVEWIAEDPTDFDGLHIPFLILALCIYEYCGEEFDARRSHGCYFRTLGCGAASSCDLEWIRDYVC